MMIKIHFNHLYNNQHFMMFCFFTGNTPFLLPEPSNKKIQKKIGDSYLFIFKILSFGQILFPTFLIRNRK